MIEPVQGNRNQGKKWSGVSDVQKFLVQLYIKCGADQDLMERFYCKPEMPIEVYMELLEAIREGLAVEDIEKILDCKTLFSAIQVRHLAIIGMYDRLRTTSISTDSNKQLKAHMDEMFLQQNTALGDLLKAARMISTDIKKLKGLIEETNKQEHSDAKEVLDQKTNVKAIISDIDEGGRARNYSSGFIAHCRQKQFIKLISNTSFNTEQLAVLMQAYESGIPIKDIKKIADPKIPTERMQAVVSLINTKTLLKNKENK